MHSVCLVVLITVTSTSTSATLQLNRSTTLPVSSCVILAVCCCLLLFVVECWFVVVGKREQTCIPALGYSFAAGTVDGPGEFDFIQGLLFLLVRCCLFNFVWMLFKVQTIRILSGTLFPLSSPNQRPSRRPARSEHNQIFAFRFYSFAHICFILIVVLLLGS